MKWFIIPILILIAAFSSDAQSMETFKNDNPTHFFVFKNIGKEFPSLINRRPYSVVLKKKNAVPSDWVFRNYGFFCKNEVKFNKSNRIPVKFRLGTLEYVNQLEYLH